MHSRPPLPELLLPAGNLEKLKVAVLYGADAVYLGGQKFGLRAASDNFTESELAQGVNFAHARGAKVYVVLNGFLHDKDLVELPPFLGLLEELNVDAVIVSDLGVLSSVKKHSRLPIHLSTQASCLNSASARLWKKMGASRIILGREVSLLEAQRIKQKAQVEVEMFIHGSLCMAYSGNCTISNYTQGRDSNRGGCAHSCRFEYTLQFAKYGEEKSAEKKTYFMSSKDLNGLELLPQFIEAGINSIKVEGRMKSHLYAGTVAKVYREALNLMGGRTKVPDPHQAWINLGQELKKMSHRDHTWAGLTGIPGPDSVYAEREGLHYNEQGMAGIVLDVQENKHIVVQVRSAFNRGEALELIPFTGSPLLLSTNQMMSLEGNPTERSKPSTLIKLPFVPGAQKWNFLRKKVGP